VKDAEREFMRSGEKPSVHSTVVSNRSVFGPTFIPPLTEAMEDFGGTFDITDIPPRSYRESVI
jgi:hypothetical protein